MANDEEPKIYSPAEAAKKLGISMRMLGYYRRTGRIKGIDRGNATFYTEAQLAKADLRRFKTGPKIPGQEQEYLEADQERYAYANLA